MSVNPRTGCAVLVLVYLAAGLLRAYEFSIKPTRAECIIGYNMDWQGIKNPTSVLNSMVENLHRKPRLAGFMISNDATQFYFQYFNHCEKKERMTNEMIESWKSQGLNLPKMERINGPIKISPSTIDINGSAWRD